MEASVWQNNSQHFQLYQSAQEIISRALGTPLGRPTYLFKIYNFCRKNSQIELKKGTHKRKAPTIIVVLKLAWVFSVPTVLTLLARLD